MITNKQSYLTGYMVGCRLREGRPSGVMGEPIGYLYGTLTEPLPVLPEWDRETYPVAFIYQYLNYATYKLVVCPAYYYYESSTSGAYMLGTNAPALRWTCNSGEDTWGEPTTLDKSEGIATVGSDKYKWANTDMLYADGTVALSASDPIPVYE